MEVAGVSHKPETQGVVLLATCSFSFWGDLAHVLNMVEHLKRNEHLMLPQYYGNGATHWSMLDLPGTTPLKNKQTTTKTKKQTLHFLEVINCRNLDS